MNFRKISDLVRSLVVMFIYFKNSTLYVLHCSFQEFEGVFFFFFSLQ